jgi:hypothetical protein
MINTYDMLLRLLVAALLGSIIGWERERRQWTAGLRTHMMVGLGSALVMLVSTYGFNDVVGKPGIALDPSRVPVQDLQKWDMATHQWKIYSGKYKLLLGSNSADEKASVDFTITK